ERLGESAVPRALLHHEGEELEEGGARLGRGAQLPGSSDGVGPGRVACGRVATRPGPFPRGPRGCHADDPARPAWETSAAPHGAMVEDRGRRHGAAVLATRRVGRRWGGPSPCGRSIRCGG